MTPRHQTSTQRDLDGLEAKKKRESQPMRANELAVPHEVKDVVTGVVPAGPELDKARAEREPEDRFLHLEHKNDKLVEVIVKMSGLGLDDILAGRKARRDLILKVVVGLLGLATAFLLGSKVH